MSFGTGNASDGAAGRLIFQTGSSSGPGAQLASSHKSGSVEIRIGSHEGSQAGDFIARAGNSTSRDGSGGAIDI